MKLIKPDEDQKSKKSEVQITKMMSTPEGITTDPTAFKATIQESGKPDYAEYATLAYSAALKINFLPLQTIKTQPRGNR